MIGGRANNFSVAEAVELTGHSDDTIRRRLKIGDSSPGGIRGARRLGDGPNAPWSIPFDGLLASGLLEATKTQPVVGPPTAADDDGREHLHRTIDRLLTIVEALTCGLPAGGVQ